MIDLSTLPTEPGCYIFQDKTGKVLYVGKARVLKKRVSSYFRKRTLDPKTAALVKNIEDLDFIVTDNEVEALVLENNLIKKHQPKYNINLKESVRYAYIELTRDDFPRLLVSRYKEGNGLFYGPFVSAAARNHIMFALKRTFKIRTCKRMPKRPCLRHHIDLCQAPCIGNISKTKYSDNIRIIKLILKGQTTKLVKTLTTEMKATSAEQKFERALELRNQIEAINGLNERQNMERQKKYDEDIMNYIEKNGKVYLILFNVYKGILENKQEFEFDRTEDFMDEFIVQYYSDKNIPKELILPQEIDSSLIDLLKMKRKGAFKVIVPKRGEKKKLLNLVMKNVEVTFFGHLEKLDDLKDKLALHEVPEVIECFDISHLSGTSMVGSMVQFRNGLPDKSNYRRFKIRTVEGVDDTGAIAEVIKRRYTRLQKENSEMPNLIIIDGGRGQLNAALGQQKALEIQIPTIAIAKRLEEIYLPGGDAPLRLPAKSKALLLIRQIRDEAHRFAIKYNRLLRKKELIE